MTRFLVTLLLPLATFSQTPEALRRHVSYLASDELKGRSLPSPGLDAAADYIAAEFKKVKLEPAAEGYFQKYERVLMRPDWNGYEFVVRSGNQTFRVLPTDTQPFASKAMTLDDVELVKADPESATWLKSLRKEDIAGKVVAFQIVAPAESQEKQENNRIAMAAVTKLSPALIILLGPGAAALDVPGVLLDPGQTPPDRASFPVRTDELRARLGSMPGGPTGMRVTLHLQKPIFETITLRNVAGILRGSDPALRDTFEIVTANYDGFPTRRIGPDPINNAANANASGVAGLIEIAHALAQGVRPKRSILFLAICGEMPAGSGGKHYLEHPLVPFDKSVHSVNLLHLGRTDTSDGPKVMSAAISGFGRSKAPAAFQSAGASAGVTFTEAPKDVESTRGVPALLLSKQIPSHSIYVALSFPDYHRVSDEAGKLDHVNMAKITQAIAAGLRRIASEQ